MQLCDRQIYEAMAKGDLIIAGTNPKYPFQKDLQVQPASVDLHLANRVIRFKKDVRSFDIKNIKMIASLLEINYLEDGEAIEIGPNEILYAEIYEQISIPNYLCARIEGRSRVARLGLSVHCTGDYINPGFAGAMPLQIINHNSFPIVLYPYIDICQMILYQLSETPLVSYLERSGLPYNKYYNETNPSPSILSSEPRRSASDNSIVELKIRQLVENYYNTKEEEAKKTRRDSIDKREIRSMIEETAKINIQNLVIGGEQSVGDQYSTRQVGIQGNITNSEASIAQNYKEEKSINTDLMMKELERIKEYFLDNYADDEKTRRIIDSISSASCALHENNTTKAMVFLKKFGKTVFEVAKAIGCALVAKYLEDNLGLQ